MIKPGADYQIEIRIDRHQNEKILKNITKISENINKVMMTDSSARLSTYFCQFNRH